MAMLPLCVMSQSSIGSSMEALGTDATAAVQFPPMPAQPSGTAWIVISKKNLTLSVYDRNAAGDTILMAQFPCCMGKNKGNKMRRGDMRTPESPDGRPFKHQGLWPLVPQVGNARTPRHRHPWQYQ